MEFLSSLFRVLITFENNYRIDLNEGSFADLLGFDKAITVAKMGYGSRVPDITRSVDNIFIHTSIMSKSIISGVESDGIHRFSIDTHDLPLSYPFHIEGRRLNQYKCHKRNANIH